MKDNEEGRPLLVDEEVEFVVDVEFIDCAAKGGDGGGWLLG